MQENKILKNNFINIPCIEIVIVDFLPLYHCTYLIVNIRVSGSKNGDKILANV